METISRIIGLRIVSSFPDASFYPIPTHIPWELHTNSPPEEYPFEMSTLMMETIINYNIKFYLKL